MVPTVSLHARPDSLVGCPGILDAARGARVPIANAVGLKGVYSGGGSPPLGVVVEVTRLQ